MNMIKSSFAVLLLFPLMACGNDSAEPENLPDISAVYKKMESLTQDKSCEIDSDCGVMPTGERACGGPSGYMVYSQRLGTESISQLESLAKQSSDMARLINEKSDMMSTCDVLPPATAACIENQCTIVESNQYLDPGNLPTNKDDGLSQ